MHRPSEKEVHLWLRRLEASDADFESLWQSLSPDECRRAEAFRFARHRRRFVIAHGWLRAVLAGYLGCHPGEVVFGQGEAGKPYSLMQPATWRLDFNLSHSEDSAAIAISGGIEVGVDIEHIRPIDEIVLAQILSAEEQAQFQALPTALRNNAVFDSWTRKEACLKALGTGLQTPPTWFEFDIGGDHATLRRVGDSIAEANLWQVSTFRAPGPCSGAVAARARGWSLVTMEPWECPETPPPRSPGRNFRA